MKTIAIVSDKGGAGKTIKRQHIGARVPQDKYRQLKAHAVLTGIPVQALVEKIIDQYLASLPQQDRA